jgi:hypothetical protein
MNNIIKKNSNRRSANAILLMLLMLAVIVSITFLWFTNSNMQTLNFNTVSGPILNPLMGWTPWANLKDEILQPHTLVYADLTWRDFEPQEGVFDFVNFERKQQLSYWRQNGMRVIFRFVTDVPGTDAHMDIPDWLYEKINGDGQFYENEYGKGFSPNYANPLFLKYHYLALKALGDKYGGDGFFAFIELGSLGHWGEWHVSSELQPLPSENIRDLYVFDYKNAFPQTYLLMRRPFSIAKKLNLGLYNDQTGDVTGTNFWLDWIQNGGDYLPTELNSLVPMPDGWEKAPIGGEQATNRPSEDLYGVDLATTLQLLKESHTTFIGPGGPFNVELNGSLQAGIDQILSTIGYRLYVDKVELPLNVKLGRVMRIKINFKNDGIAPFYYAWPTRLYLYDESGKTLVTYPLQMDLRKILPGSVYQVPFDLPVGDLANGKYKLGFAILDPLTNRPGVKLANVTQRNDLIHDVGSFEVNWLFDFSKK